MIKNPTTLADVQANLAESGRLKHYTDLGMSQGAAEIAVSVGAELRALNAPKPVDAATAADLEKYRLKGMSEGQADFAANMRLPK